MKNPVAQGFSLIELMIAIGISGILVSVAVPNFTDFILSSRSVTQTNELVLSMTYAKSEAVKRNGRVTVCARQTDSACATAANWDNGWLVFADNNGDGVVDADVPDVVLQVRGALEGGNTLRAGTRAWLTFGSTGFLRPGNNDTLRLCDRRGATKAEAITVSLQGWLNTQQGTATCP